ncbi:MAG: phenylalanine--tRNA ligase subunit beta [Planctomycetaceae bacterium]|nr:phenylalanine--tRNA ligase subunit beta [Planctomycetaceae bacterium]
MKISMDWLRDYVETALTPQQIGDILCHLGFPIEAIETIAADTMINVEVTSNRGDCLSHIGIARELAAVDGKPVKIPPIALRQTEPGSCTLIQVQIQEPALCNRYTARVIRNVKVGPSPDWMVKRLQTAGLRSINNVVDATNYVMLETGQPTHAFDYDKIGGGKIIVRPAVKGERLISIDGTKCDLDEAMLVIADASKPVALAGVMGGLDSEVTEGTTTVLLEAAHFDPVTVRRAARKLSLPSEASFRFERQVDTENIEYVSARCAQLIAEFSQGQAAQGMVDAWPRKMQRDTIGMRFSRLRALLGIDIPREKVLSIFQALGLGPEMKNEDLVVCTSPSWRHDLYREADLIEEAARCYGYDKIPVEPKIHIEVCPPNLREQTAAKVRTFLNGCGFYETINVSFVNTATVQLFTAMPPQSHLAVSQVSQKNMNLLRQDLLGSLAQVLQSNYRAGNRPCRLFELADTFVPAEHRPAGQLPQEQTQLGLILDDEFRVLRGVLEGMLKQICIRSEIEFRPASFKWAQAGAELLVNGRLAGMAAALHPDTAASLDMAKQTISAAQVNFDLLLDCAGAIPTARPVPRFPAIVRDLSLIIDEPVLWASISETIRAKAPSELEQIDFTGLYRGKPIPSGKKSVTVSLRFRDEQGTLRHETVDAWQSEIMDALAAKLGAQLRTV